MGRLPGPATCLPHKDGGIPLSALLNVVNVGTTTIHVPNLLMCSLLVPLSLAISCIISIVQAISLLQ